MTPGLSSPVPQGAYRRDLSTTRQLDKRLRARGLHCLTSVSIDSIDLTEREHVDLLWLRHQLTTPAFIRTSGQIGSGYEMRRVAIREAAGGGLTVAHESVAVAGHGVLYFEMAEERAKRRLAASLESRLHAANELYAMRRATLLLMALDALDVDDMGEIVDKDTRLRSYVRGYTVPAGAAVASADTWLRRNARDKAKRAQMVAPLTTQPLGSFYTANQKDWVR